MVRKSQQPIFAPPPKPAFLQRMLDGEADAAEAAERAREARIAAREAARDDVPETAVDAAGRTVEVYQDGRVVADSTTQSGGSLQHTPAADAQHGSPSGTTLKDAQPAMPSTATRAEATPRDKQLLEKHRSARSSHSAAVSVGGQKRARDVVASSVVAPSAEMSKKHKAAPVARKVALSFADEEEDEED